MATLSPKVTASKGLQLAGDPQAEWRDITPDIAGEWLKLNTLNRPKKLQKIALYAADMKGGHWPVTGATISFGKSGRLLDGQNRLQAVIDSGATIRVLVVWGLDDDVFDVIDGGARRTASDVLVIEGYEGWAAACGPSGQRQARRKGSGEFAGTYRRWRRPRPRSQGCRSRRQVDRPSGERDAQSRASSGPTR